MLAVSESTRDSRARFGVPDVMVVPEGYQPSELPLPESKEDTPTIVYCARMLGYERPA